MAVKPRLTALFAVLALMWVVTPFMGNHLPTWIHWIYWWILIFCVVIGIVSSVHYRKPLLGVFSFFSLLAWPIVMFFVLPAGGIS